MDRGDWWATVHRVAKSRTQLKRLSTHTHMHTHVWLPYYLLSEPQWLILSQWTYQVKSSQSHSVMSDSLRPHGLHSPWNSTGQNTGVGNLSLLQGIFPTQGSNPGLPHRKQIVYQLSHKESSNEPILTYNYHSKFIVYIRVHPWWCSFYGFWQMYNEGIHHCSSI